MLLVVVIGGVYDPVGVIIGDDSVGVGVYDSVEVVIMLKTVATLVSV